MTLAMPSHTQHAGQTLGAGTQGRAATGDRHRTAEPRPPAMASPTRQAAGTPGAGAQQRVAAAQRPGTAEPMSVAIPSHTQHAGRATSSLSSLSSTRRRSGLCLLAVGGSGWAGWLVWRLATLPAHVIPVIATLIETVGVITAGVVASALARRQQPRAVYQENPDEWYRYAHNVADIVGRTRSEDLHRDIRSVVRAARRPLHRDHADLAVACVLIDGPRRLVLVVTATIGLLLGVSPVPSPSPVALVAGAVGVLATALAIRTLSGDCIALGDRVRWTYSSLGEIVAREDVEGVAPRRWVGTVATIVVINLALALRGMSDRWTHGLPPMGDGPRLVAMLYALTLLIGALFTLATTSAPQLDNAHLVARRLEERTARQSALGGAVCVGLVGLLAGILPGDVEPTDDDPVRIERISQAESEPAVDG